MIVYLLCGGYYTNFDYPKSLTKIKDERLVDRTIRLLKSYNTEIIVCHNPEENAFDEYNHLSCNFTFDYMKQKGYYLDVFDGVSFNSECIFLFGDVYYTENAIQQIIERFNSTDRNVFICNQYPFNEQHLRQGEPFGWIVKDVDEFKYAVKLGKKFQDRGVIDHSNGIPSNWELAHIINGLGVNDFNLRKEDCLVIADKTIDIDDPSSIAKLEQRL